MAAFGASSSLYFGCPRRKSTRTSRMTCSTARTRGVEPVVVADDIGEGAHALGGFVGQLVDLFGGRDRCLEF
jgi:hypothetical protein